MKKNIIIFVASILAGCGSHPLDVLDQNPLEISQNNDFELCRTLYYFDATNRRKQNSSLPIELIKRNISTDECFDILLDEHGIDTFCSEYSDMIFGGKPFAWIALGTKISRSDLEYGFKRNNINCYASEYVKYKSHTPDSSVSASAMAGLINGLNKAYSTNKSTTVPRYDPPSSSSSKTVCRQYSNGTLTCKTK